jgi:hypothetical protein
MIIWIIYLFIIRIQYWKIAVWSTIVFVAIWFILANLIIKIWPDIPTLWTWNQFSGRSFVGYPIEELIWAVLYSISWSITIAYILDIKTRTILKPDLIPSVKQ